MYANSVMLVVGACHDRAEAKACRSSEGISPTGWGHDAWNVISKGWRLVRRRLCAGAGLSGTVASGETGLVGLIGAMASGETGLVDLVGSVASGKVGWGLVGSVASGKTGRPVVQDFWMWWTKRLVNVLG